MLTTRIKAKKEDYHSFGNDWYSTAQIYYPREYRIVDDKDGNWRVEYRDIRKYPTHWHIERDINMGFGTFLPFMLFDTETKARQYAHQIAIEHQAKVDRELGASNVKYLGKLP